MCQIHSRGGLDLATSLSDAASDTVDREFIAWTDERMRELKNMGCEVSETAVLNMYRTFDGNLNMPWILTSYAFEAQDNDLYGDVLNANRALKLTDSLLEYSSLRIHDVPVLFNFPLVTKQQLKRLPRDRQGRVATKLFDITKRFIAVYKPESIIVMHCIFDFAGYQTSSRAANRPVELPPIGDFCDPVAQHLSSTPILDEDRKVYNKLIGEHWIRLVMSRHPQGLRAVKTDPDSRPSAFIREGFKDIEDLGYKTFHPLFEAEYGPYSKRKRENPSVVGRRNNLAFWYEHDMRKRDPKRAGENMPQCEYYTQPRQDTWRSPPPHYYSVGASCRLQNSSQATSVSGSWEYPMPSTAQNIPNISQDNSDMFYHAQWANSAPSQSTAYGSVTVGLSQGFESQGPGTQTETGDASFSSISSNVSTRTLVNGDLEPSQTLRSSNSSRQQVSSPETPLRRTESRKLRDGFGRRRQTSQSGRSDDWKRGLRSSTPTPSPRSTKSPASAPSKLTRGRHVVAGAAGVAKRFSLRGRLQ